MDYKLVYDETNQYCDVELETINDGKNVIDITDGGDLITAVLISLLSDRVADSDWTLASDKRGWWADSENELPIGSRLWQLSMLPTSDSEVYLSRAEGYVKEALEWLINDNICKEVNCTASFLDIAYKHLNLDISLVKADNSVIRYEYVWNSN